MASFDSLSPNELAILSTILALSIAEGRTASDLNIIGNFIVAVGGILLTMAPQKEILERQAAENAEKQDKIKDLEKQIKDLKK